MSKLSQISEHEKPPIIRAKLPTMIIVNPRAKIGGRKISWSPSTLCFVLDEDQVTHRLWITNRCDRTIFFHCCGLWNDTVRLGASWCCFPRTRIWLPPGLRAPLYVRATPRDIISPIPDGVTFMQIAAAHLRDNVTGYFSIPIKAKFLKYIPPPVAEGE